MKGNWFERKWGSDPVFVAVAPSTTWTCGREGTRQWKSQDSNILCRPLCSFENNMIYIYIYHKHCTTMMQKELFWNICAGHTCEKVRNQLVFQKMSNKKRTCMNKQFFSVPGTWGSHQVRGSLFLPQKSSSRQAYQCLGWCLDFQVRGATWQWFGENIKWYQVVCRWFCIFSVSVLGLFMLSLRHVKNGTSSANGKKRTWTSIFPPKTGVYHGLSAVLLKFLNDIHIPRNQIDPYFGRFNPSNGRSTSQKRGHLGSRLSYTQFGSIYYLHEVSI